MKPTRQHTFFCGLFLVASAGACAFADTDAMTTDPRSDASRRGGDASTFDPDAESFRSPDGSPTGADAGAGADAARADAVTLGPCTEGAHSAGAPAPSDPQYLPHGRTYDQQTSYVATNGTVRRVMLEHHDNTTVPASEGGAACTTSCNEEVSRIEDGGEVWGRFRNATVFNVQAAFTTEPGVGSVVIEACGQVLGTINLTNAGRGLPGFVNLPQGGWAVPDRRECEWHVRARGGFVYFRAATITLTECVIPPSQLSH